MKEKDKATGREGDTAKAPVSPAPVSEDDKVTRALDLDDIRSPQGQPGGAAQTNLSAASASREAGGGTSDGSSTADAAAGAPPPPPQPPAPEPRIFVEVICEGVLGPKLLKKGDRTDDPDYVKLLGDRRGLVRRV
jgi:hypothetical protein